MEFPKPIVILGTARQDGDTRRAVEIAFPSGETDLISISGQGITGYDYGHKNASDAFLAIVEEMLKTDTIVFATPVYWYAMSAELKMFFDRLSDLLTIAKEKGRAIKGRSVWLISCGAEQALPAGFEVPFSRTAEYFEMHYRGAAYLYTGEDRQIRAVSEAAMSAFGQHILATRARV